MVTQSRDMNELHPKVKELAEKLIEACRKQGINIGISETYRTKERQDYLYAQGRTRPGNIVTYVRGSDMRSYHQWRLAFDVYINKKGDEYNSTLLKKVGDIGTNLGLEWGGSWSGFKDTPHFQYTFGLSIQDLKRGKNPPANIDERTSKQTFQDGYERAVEGLVKAGIIQNKDSWSPEPNLKYTETLIVKLGERILGIKEYNQIIELFAKNSAITQVDLWKNKKYTVQDVKWLVQKIVKYL